MKRFWTWYKMKVDCWCTMMEAKCIIAAENANAKKKAGR